METNKLYRVLLKGMTHNSTGVAYGDSYVVATNPEEAYRKVRTFLDDEDLGFDRERCLESVTLLAEEYHYTDTGHLLFIGVAGKNLKFE